MVDFKGIRRRTIHRTAIIQCTFKCLQKYEKTKTLLSVQSYDFYQNNCFELFSLPIWFRSQIVFNGWIGCDIPLLNSCLHQDGITGMISQGDLLLTTHNPKYWPWHAWDSIELNQVIRNGFSISFWQWKRMVEVGTRYLPSTLLFLGQKTYSTVTGWSPWSFGRSKNFHYSHLFIVWHCWTHFCQNLWRSS